ncbi:MAG: SDR family NAD(P)-dependent oxidoreductase [Caldilineaceae bacterium]
MSYLDQLFSLEGKFAVVTGASRGLGNAIADALLRAGATVLLVSANQERLQAATAAFQAEGLRAAMHCCDLADKAQIAALLAAIGKDPGRVDILVNAAGMTEGHPLLDYPADVWERTLQVNLTAAFLLAQGVAALMVEQQSGSIINITSINAERGFPGNPAYVAAKGALKQLSKALAVDLAPYGIRVNNIGPGYFHTDWRIQAPLPVPESLPLILCRAVPYMVVSSFNVRLLSCLLYIATLLHNSKSLGFLF